MVVQEDVEQTLPISPSFVKKEKQAQARLEAPITEVSEEYEKTRGDPFPGKSPPQLSAVDVEDNGKLADLPSRSNSHAPQLNVESPRKLTLAL